MTSLDASKQNELILWSFYQAWCGHPHGKTCWTEFGNNTFIMWAKEFNPYPANVENMVSS